MSMSNGVTGGNFTTLADLKASRPRSGTKLSLNGEFEYFVDDSDVGGVLLNNGNYANPINVSPEHYGAVVDGVSDDSAFMQSAVTYAKSQTGEVFLKKGKYLVSSVTIEDVHVRGVGVGENDVPYDDNGTVIIITDTVNPAFEIKRGAAFSGCNFFYPDQDGVAASPVVYPALFRFDTASTVVNFTLDNCVLVNPYKAIECEGTASVAHGRINISRVQAYAVSEFFSGSYILDDVHIYDFVCSPGVYQDVANTGSANLRKWTQANGVFCTLSNTIDGLSFTNGIVFGYSKGIATSGAVDLFNCDQVSFDQTPIVYDKQSGTVLNAVFSDCDIYAFDSDTPTLDVPVFRSTGAGSISELIIANCHFIKSHGAIIKEDGTGASLIKLNGNIVKNWGNFTGATGNQAAVLVGNSSAIVRVDNNEFFTSYATNSAVNGVSFDQLSVRNNDARTADQAFIFSSGNVGTCMGNSTANTVTNSQVLGTVTQFLGGSAENNFDIP